MVRQLKLVLLSCALISGAAMAAELSSNIRTVLKDASGATTVLSLDQYLSGQRLFNEMCYQCHQGGITKTNHNIGLGLDDLAKAEPSRNHLEGLVDYLKNPTTYDGIEEISDLHPNTKNQNFFPEMMKISETDLESISGYILIQGKLDSRWGKRGNW